MTKDETLDLALDALENQRIFTLRPDHDGKELTPKQVTDAITAIKQARSAPVQEPVAWMGTDIEGNPNKFRLNPFNGGVELYKKPQSVKVWDAEGYDALMQELELWKAAAQRQWVGLTDEEFEDIELGCRSTSFGKIEAMQKVEAKLKEKNT